MNRFEAKPTATTIPVDSAPSLPAAPRLRTNDHATAANRAGHEPPLPSKPHLAADNGSTAAFRGGLRPPAVSGAPESPPTGNTDVPHRSPVSLCDEPRRLPTAAARTHPNPRAQPGTPMSRAAVQRTAATIPVGARPPRPTAPQLPADNSASETKPAEHEPPHPTAPPLAADNGTTAALQGGLRTPATSGTHPSPRTPPRTPKTRLAVHRAPTTALVSSWPFRPELTRSARLRDHR